MARVCGPPTLEALAKRLGMTVASIISDVAPGLPAQEVTCLSLQRQVATGAIIGTTDRTHTMTREGPGFEFGMEGRVYGDGETDSNH